MEIISKPFMGWDTNGKMDKNLLNKTTRTFLIFSVLILLVFAPVFYFITERLYIEETDETLFLHKEEFFNQYLSGFKEADILVWNKYNRNVKIVGAKGLTEDVYFDKVYYDKAVDENEKYRELNAPITIEGKPYTFTAKNNLIESSDMLLSIAGMFSLMIVILLGGILLISKISSKRLWKPFYDTLEKIRGFEIDKSRKPQFTSTEIAEFNELNKSILPHWTIF